MEFSRQNKIYIMPKGFGPAGGPRQAPNHQDYRHVPTKFTRYVVGFLGRADQISALLPPGLALRGDPVVQFQFYSLTEIPWLAGRGYNLLSMLVPVRFRSAGGDAVDGQYQPVLWENLGDPIITGREQLGHPKLYAQLPPPRHWNGRTYIRASWEDFTFAELDLSCTDAPDPKLLEDIKAGAGSGLIGHKYIPTTGRWDEADADYFTLTPMPGELNRRDPQPPPTIKSGTGVIRFNVPSWQDMPTQYHIVEQLAALEQCAPLTAVSMQGSTYAGASDTRILA
jgi:hypothetical protein